MKKSEMSRQDMTRLSRHLRYEVFRWLCPELKAAGFWVLDFILWHTLEWGHWERAIPLTDFTEGYWNKEGELVHAGVGISERSLYRQLVRLEDMNLISISKKRVGRNKTVNCYRPEIEEIKATIKRKEKQVVKRRTGLSAPREKRKEQRKVTNLPNWQEGGAKMAGTPCQNGRLRIGEDRIEEDRNLGAATAALAREVKTKNKTKARRLALKDRQDGVVQIWKIILGENNLKSISQLRTKYVTMILRANKNNEETIEEIMRWAVENWADMPDILRWRNMPDRIDVQFMARNWDQFVSGYRYRDQTYTYRDSEVARVETERDMERRIRLKVQKERDELRKQVGHKPQRRDRGW